jgi:RNA ligase (TIGR02306 family)
MEKIATIQIIENVEHVTDSDFLDVVKVLGWQVVTKRGEFTKGDLCIFVPIDSILPDRPCFEFMRNKNFRVKSIKLRKCLSQGIVFPLTILESILNGKIIEENNEKYLEIN